MSNEEQQFTIQPHPAVCSLYLPIPQPHRSNSILRSQKSNEPPQLGAGLNNNPELSALNARGPHVPAADKIKSMEAPAVSVFDGLSRPTPILDIG